MNLTIVPSSFSVPGSASGGTNDDIIEIDGVAPTKIAKLSLPGDAPSGNTLFTQPPIISTIFTDPVTRQDVCLVIISLLSRIKKIDFDVILRDDSHVLQVSYSWPQYSYSCEEMFKKEWENRPFVDQLHPKYQAVEKALESVRENFEDAPQGKIEVTLPTNVQLDPSTWKNYANKKTDGMLLVFFEFLCARSDYIIKKKEKFMILE